MTHEQALQILHQLVEQTRLLPAEYRQLQEALRVLSPPEEPVKAAK